MNRTDVANRPARRVCLPRLVLLVLLALGVAGMHTLGHADSSGHAGFSPSAHGRNEVAMDLNAVSKETPAATPADSADRGIHTLALAVCLAVLGAGAILLLRPVATRPRSVAGTFNLGGRNLTGSGRGPPARRVGLRLAEVSVLRL